ncbi:MULTISPECIES: LPS export ABC transporter periplasmic protein LptC [unclassified Coleofasciculus]|uniref:LPS export ABC transporter periplasmic protein LptC n=1 Tax=unclassified Coleofasciculus TaxID=2692782 RepID=UPI0018811501|nr:MULTISPECIES: LPS export ABC transporter periplasmic protein LptC [unclassified Coleofasciculus]MBE9124961.1 LPS export ABC transporter periplasmic protein LptC [Coleofasciculus sp. LEGE 07081]MBE9147985.1 LPS export ABC transporter periplasmic protein LptC [Coleofasciculus sp. LEGE 07092]
MILSFKNFFAFSLCLLALTSLSACQSDRRTAKKLDKDTSATEIEGSLVFNNVTLDQFDEKGHPLWRVKAEKATYINDKKTALIEKPTGDLFQDGKLVVQVSADSGEVQEDGKTILLKGKITATDTRNGTVFKGDELEWYPQDDLLVVRNNLKGIHPEQIEASAKEGRYITRKQQVDLKGSVTALSKNPNLQMKTEHLVWQIKEQKLIGDQRSRMERYKDKTVIERVEADQSEYNLKTKVAILKQNAQFTSVDPPVLISTNSAIWNLNTETVLSDQPVKIFHQKENVVLTANQGQVDLEKNVANLTGGVQGVGSRNQAELYANQMRWEIPTQNIQASGNVIYKQIDPPFNVTGATAVGKLQDQSIVVSSGASGDRVVTEFIP